MEIKESGVRLAKDDQAEMKEFYSLDNLVSYLTTKLGMDDNELEFAREFLRCNNYYSFSIYVKQVPKEIETGKFFAAVTLYDFNAWLSNTLFHFSGKLEQFIKATFIEALCNKYDGDFQKGECYLDPEIYESEALYQEFIAIIEKHLSENQSLAIKHHLMNRNGKFPIWVLFQEMTFGETTRFISSLKQEYREWWISETFLTSDVVNAKIHGQEIQSKLFGWVSATWHIRNRTAHHLRLYGQNFTVASPSFFSDDLRRINKNATTKKLKTHNKDLFAYLLAMKNLVQHHSPSFQKEWNNFLDALDSKFKEHVLVIQPSKIGFPNNWKDILFI